MPRETIVRHLFRTVALAAASMLAAFSAAAQTWPTRPITLVVPFAAGSGSDTGARIVGEYLGAALGQRLVVENRVGAVGAIGASAVARAQPDGYTLLVGTNSTHGSNPALLATMPYDPIKDFVPIVRVGIFTYFVVVNPSLPIRSMADLVAEAKAKPDQLSYGSGSSTSHVMAETFMRGVGIKALRVPYTSNPPALTDIIAGRVSFMFVDVSTSISHVREGALRAIAITSPTRSSVVPDVPTIKETVLPNFDMESWIGFYAPAGTPQPIVERLAGEIGKVLALPAVKERLAQLGVDIRPLAGADFSAFTKSEVEKWTRFVHEAGIQPN